MNDGADDGMEEDEGGRASPAIASVGGGRRHGSTPRSVIIGVKFFILAYGGEL